MAGNRRDLHVGLDADDRGFGGTFEDAKEDVQGLDRELAKLERQQAANEKVTTRSTAAVDRFGKAQDKAALAAHRLGLEAKRAADQAEKAEVRAAAAADAAAKGLLDKTKADQLAARADDQVERASLKAAEAHRAQARAADEAADQERQLAREAELAGVAQRLAILKAGGAIKSHNALIQRTEDKYGDLSREASGAFRVVESQGGKAFKSVDSAATSFASSGPGSIALVVAALGAVPFAALGAESAIALGVGGALAGVGLAATKSDVQVQGALGRMTSHVKSETKELAAPFKATWLEIAESGTETFDSLAPTLKKDFAVLAPAVSRFANSAGVAITRLAPAFDAASHAAGTLLDELGPKLPEISRNLGNSVKIMSDSAADAAPELANVAVSLSKTLPPLAHSLDLAVKLAPAYNLAFGAISGGADDVDALRGGLSYLTGGLISTDKSLHIGGGSFKTFAEQADSASVPTTQLAADMAKVHDSGAAMKDRVAAATDALGAYYGPASAAWNATTALKQGMDELAKAMKAAKGDFSGNSQKSQELRAALDQQLGAVAALNQANLQTKGADVARKKSEEQIQVLYALAGRSKSARAQIDALATSLGVSVGKSDLSKAGFMRAAAAMNVSKSRADALWKAYQRLPAAKNTKLSSNAAAAKQAVQDYQNKLNSLHGKTVTVHTVYTVSGTTFGPGNRKLGAAAHGGPIHRAGGGAVARMADGGPSGPVVGPGSGTSDDIPVWLSNGEWVVRASQARKHSALLAAINDGRAGFATGGPVGYATGGTVADVGLSSILSDWASIVKPSTKAQVDAAIKSRKTQINQLASAEDALAKARKRGSSRDIAAAERRIATERSDLAAATAKLADVQSRYKYTAQKPATQLASALSGTIKNTAAFIANLTKLTDKGFGVLAQNLLAMGGAGAEKIAADAVKLSTSKLSGLQKQVQQTGQQQTTLAGLGGILTIKTAMQGGANTWDTLIAATGLAPNDLAASLKLMAGDLQKTAAGQALLAMMKAHGFARGGLIAGPAGTDRVPMWGTAGEWVVPKGPAAEHRQLLAALTYGRPLPAGTTRGGDGAAAGRPIEISVYARDSQSAIATAKATSHELGWAMKRGGT